MTGIRANSVDQDGRAVLVSAGSEVLVETLATEDDVKGVIPCKVKRKQIFDKRQVPRYVRPRCSFTVGVYDGVSQLASAEVLVFRDQSKTSRVTKVSTLASLRDGWLSKQETQVIL